MPADEVIGLNDETPEWSISQSMTYSFRDHHCDEIDVQHASRTLLCGKQKHSLAIWRSKWDNTSQWESLSERAGKAHTKNLN